MTSSIFRNKSREIFFFLFVKSQQGPNSQYQTFLYEIYLQLRNKVLGDFKTIRFTFR